MTNATPDAPPLGRPLTARSVVASVLLGMHRPELSAQRLVRTAELFGLAEGTTRVALSRMVSAGELAAGDGRYRLAGPLLERQARQNRSRRAVLDGWDGSWLVAVVEPGPRPAGERVELRRILTAAGLAEWREGVWTRPANVAVEGRDPTCRWCTARFEDRRSERELAARLWDLGGWVEGATELRRRMADSVGQLEAGQTEALAPCFVTAAAVVRQIAADPLLPAELVAARWPGQALRADYDRYEAAYQALLRTFLRGLE